MMTSRAETATALAPPQAPPTLRHRVLLVDDHAVVRQGIAELLKQEPDMVVCGEAEDATQGLEAVKELKPDVVLVDISLKESNGLELIKNIKARYPKLPVLVITMHDEALYAEMALRAGALGYIMKQEAIDTVLTGLRRVLVGGFYLSESMSARLLQQQIRGQHDRSDSPLDRLSERELEVFQLIGQWRGTSQIAKELHLSVKTVEYYREQIKEKLNLKNASELIRYAIQWVERQK
jgi:DNA-binding NarL/FixJ family response regulator